MPRGRRRSGGPTQSVLDRAVHNAHAPTLKGNSYRLPQLNIDTPVSRDEEHGT